MKEDLRMNDEAEVGKAENKRAKEKVPGEFPFPRNSLKEALIVPRAIEHDNAGQPYDPMLLAKQSLNTPPRSSAFEVLLTSSERYGLSVGSSRAKAISLTAKGDAIVASPDESIRASNIRRALLTPKIFEQFYSKYDGKNLPKEEILKIVLEQEFQVPKPDVDECYEVLMKNIVDYDLLIISGENRTLYLGKLMKQAAIQQPPVAQPSVAQPSVGGPKRTEEKWGGLTDLLSATNPPAAITAPEPAKIEAKVPRVFVSYCKNKNILRQIKQMLDYGKVEKVIAEEKETTAMPLSEKVFGLMLECNCAIINIGADDEKREEETPGISENILAELWGAYLHYKKRVILVIDKRLKDKLPSVMQGLTAIFYERNQLSWSDGMRLQSALNEFRNQL